MEASGDEAPLSRSGTLLSSLGWETQLNLSRPDWLSYTNRVSHASPPAQEASVKDLAAEVAWLHEDLTKQYELLGPVPSPDESAGALCTVATQLQDVFRKTVGLMTELSAGRTASRGEYKVTGLSLDSWDTLGANLWSIVVQIDQILKNVNPGTDMLSTVSPPIKEYFTAVSTIHDASRASHLGEELGDSRVDDVD